MSPTVPERILNAVQDILTARGVEHLTIRNVAESAHVSVGAVQYHYRSKDELVMAVMDKISQDFKNKLDTVLSSCATPQATLEATCKLLAGVDDESRTASVIWLAFASKATTSDSVALAHRESWTRVEEGLTKLLREVNPERTSDDAAMLMALLDGIAIARVTETDRMTSQRAQRLIDQFLAQVN